MLKKFTSFLLAVTLLSSCATIVTESTLQGIAQVPVKTQYDNCIVRFGNYGYRYPKDYHIADGAEEGGFYYFKQTLEKSSQFRLMCREITYEKIEEASLSDPFNEEQFKNIIEGRKFPAAVPVFSFYKWYRPHESPYAYWGLFYVASIGFLPLATPEEERFWIVRHNPGETKAQARLIENKRWRWWWTPFYLNPYSEKTPSKIKAETVTEEALLKAFNGT
jgi:hypothetical protein